MDRLRIFTWHIHGNYLYYLSNIPHDIYVPVGDGNEPGYGGRGSSFPFPPNVHEIPVDRVRNYTFDCILYQSRDNYLRDQYALLSADQRRLPRIYLEHDPPREDPFSSRHIVEDPDVLVVHVTPFNALMWDNGDCPVTVIEHGVVIPPGVEYSGELDSGIVVVNNLASRGRRLGLDVFEDMRQRVPLDLVGMGSAQLGGLGEIPPMELPAFEAHYRFFFNPIRWTSMGLAVCEAMMLGMPVLGLATTEMATAIQNGHSGYVETSPARLEEHAARLLRDPVEARRLGENARESALERFGIERFVRDWDATLRSVAAAPAGQGQQSPSITGVRA